MRGGFTIYVYGPGYIIDYDTCMYVVGVKRVGVTMNTFFINDVIINLCLHDD